MEVKAPLCWFSVSDCVCVYELGVSLNTRREGKIQREFLVGGNEMMTGGWMEVLSWTTYSEKVGKGLGLDDARVGGVEKSESLLEFDFRHDCKVKCWWKNVSEMKKGKHTRTTNKT